MRSNLLAALIICAGLAPAAAAQRPAAAAPKSAPVGTSIAAKTVGYVKHDGFIPVYLSDTTDKILLEIPRDSFPALMLTMQSTGLGSNPIGIDRGAGGRTQVVRFERNADHVFVVFENRRYRGAAGNPEHARTVAEAFPVSTVAALPLVAVENGRAAGGRDRVLHPRLERRDGDAAAQPGRATYALARDRSAVYAPLHEGLSEEHRGGRRAHVRDDRAAGRDRRAASPPTVGVHAARARLAAAAARRRLPAAGVGSARRLLRHHLQRLRAAHRPAAAAALDRAAPAGARRIRTIPIRRSRIRSSTTSTAASRSRSAPRRCRA